MEGRWTLSDSLLTVRMKHRVGGLALDVGFALTASWTVLFGPSGSGKTTVLRTIAGFVRPESGLVARGEKVLVSTEERVFVPPHLRPMRCAAQTAKLFPMLTVQENVAYGMPNGGGPVVDEVMELLQLTTLAGRATAGLSGGERQRVSVARAVGAAAVCERAMLLLDEPFAGLDGVLRDELAVVLRDWLAQRKVPVLSVSHDVGECFLLGAEVVRMSDGQVTEQGAVGTVLAGERERLLMRLG
jgi:molybdate transport system ATP-binding protein